MAALLHETTHRSFRVPRYIRPYFITSISMTCVIALIITISFFRVQPRVPLFYSLAEPNDYIADKAWLFVFPIFSATITIVHLLLLPVLFSHQRVMNLLFGWMTVTIQVLCLLAAVRIVMIIW